MSRAGGPGGQRGHIADVKCPACGAPPGELCRSLDIPAKRGAVRIIQKPHQARVTLAKRWLK